MKKVINSFRNAFNGIQYCVNTQRSFRIHLAVTVLVFLLTVILRVSQTEVFFLLSAVFLVLVTEVINTAIERTVDLNTRRINPIAHVAKDAAAGAVLLAAFYALIIGVLVFIPRLADLFR